MIIWPSGIAYFLNIQQPFISPQGVRGEDKWVNDTVIRLKPPPDPVEFDLQRISIEGKLQIALHEGIAIERYLDTEGFWTIGVGVTKWAGADINPETYKGRITVRHAIDMMDSVLPQYEDVVRSLIGPVSIPQHIFDALVSVAYNVGPALAQGKQTRSLIEKGRYSDAMLLWKKPLAVVGRRKKEARLARDGIYPSGKIAIWAGGVDGDKHRVIDTITTDELRGMMRPALSFV